VAEIRLVGRQIAKPRTEPNLYRLKPPRVNERALRSLASSFGLTAERRRGRLCSDVDKLVYREGTFELVMYRASGGIRFRDLSRWQVDDREADLQLDDREACRLAEEIAGRFKLARDGETRFLKAARLRLGEANGDGGESYERTIEISVCLQRVIDKIPVDGPGGQVVVALDRNGEPTGFERIWREIEAVRERAPPLRTPQAAIDEMAGQWRGRRGIVEVDEVRFGYFEGGWRTRQRYLQPAYVIFGQATIPYSRVRRKTVYVASALAKPISRLTPVLRRKAPQEARISED
jgi:hypothetical protein